MSKTINLLKFEVNDKDLQTFNNSLEKYQKFIHQIKDFNFEKYKDYLEVEDENERIINFNDLRQDEIIEVDNTEAFFHNAVEFKDGYVVVKNEK